MSDEMDVLFDHRLRNALHGTSLPPAPASLRDALEDLPRTAGGTTARSVPRWTAGAALAAGLAAVAVLGGAAIFGLGGLGPAGNATPTPSPSASASPSPTPSPSSETFDVLSPAQILERRADGTLGSERIDVMGLLQRYALGDTPSREPARPVSFATAELELGCQDARQGIAQNDVLIGAFSEDGLWTPNPAAGVVLHPYWPPGILRDDPEAVGLFSVAAPDLPRRPRRSSSCSTGISTILVRPSAPPPRPRPASTASSSTT